ncbi:MAG: hypothetical protein AABZ61_08840, partial [Bacteroidota bacterium]
NKFLADYPESALKRYEEELFAFIEQRHPEIEAELLEKKQLTDAIRSNLENALKEFAGIHSPTQSAVPQ